MLVIELSISVRKYKRNKITIDADTDRKTLQFKHKKNGIINL